MPENTKREKILAYHAPTDHDVTMQTIEIFATRYPNLQIATLGRSVLGREIPVIRFGQGRKKVLYIGSHHGMEWITTTILLRFMNEYCELLSTDGRILGQSVRQIDASRQFIVVPMLNPDGVAYALHGLSEDNPMFDRVFHMNGQKTDFSHWQANARGVDLNHNYNAGFAAYKALEADAGILGGGPTRFSGEAPESEPETAALCHLVRFEAPDLALTLHTQGEEIYYTSGGHCPVGAERIGKKLAELSGYTLSKPEGPAAYGGFTDWFIEAFERPSFTVECGRGENPLPFSDFPKMYLSLRQLLFAAPLLI